MLLGDRTAEYARQNGDVMRELFIVHALAFGLLVAATATVMATTIEVQMARGYGALNAG
jgi:hypothetical protein